MGWQQGKDGLVRFFCRYDGVRFPLCTNNDHGLCVVGYVGWPYVLTHEWDGKNVIKCPCG